MRDEALHADGAFTAREGVETTVMSTLDWTPSAPAFQAPSPAGAPKGDGSRRRRWPLWTASAFSESVRVWDSIALRISVSNRPIRSFSFDRMSEIVLNMSLERCPNLDGPRSLPHTLDVWAELRA